MTNGKTQVSPASALKETKNARKKRQRKEAEKKQENSARLPTPVKKSESIKTPSVKMVSTPNEQFGDKTISVAALFKIMDSCLQQFQTANGKAYSKMKETVVEAAKTTAAPAKIAQAPPPVKKFPNEIQPP